MKHTFATMTFLAAIGVAVAQQTETLKVDAGKPGAEIKSTMWGIFFEDINFAADGGIYAELVKNRSFEFLDPLMGWKEHKSDRFAVESNAGRAMILNRGGNTTNRRFARIAVIADKGYGLTNEGFRGMGFRKGDTYTFSVLVRQQEGSPTLRVELVDSKNSVIGQATVSPQGKEWKKYSATITSTATDAKGSLNVWFDGKGILDVDMISLFPTDTWKGRPGGMRKDLVQLLADLKPGFLRFPGGCIVEGRDLSQRYQWKKTVGPVDDREVLINRWNTEFAHRQTPDYFQSFGLGFYEYFLLAEDIGAEPLPILSCGLACQFNTAEVVPMDQLEPYVQDALDLIEFANGAVTTKWGKLRAEMGHPEPFKMKFIGVGNEQWGPQYIERYEAFNKAIKSRYPEMVIVSSAGPFPTGELFDFAWEKLRGMGAEIVDEHYYANPEWFFNNVTRYDSYDRKGPKIFAGEYAAQSKATTSPDNRNNWLTALSEAAFMTGLERNADLVQLCSYAPLFAHADGWQWTPDLIWFDNLAAYATPNYYVQQLYSTNRGTNVLNVTRGNQKVTGQDGMYASAVWDNSKKEVIVKIVNNTATTRKTQVELGSQGRYGTSASVVSLAASLDDVNAIGDPAAIKPVTGAAKVSGRKVSVDLKPYSFTVVRVPAR